jgi:hypothetical protein
MDMLKSQLKDRKDAALPQIFNKRAYCHISTVVRDFIDALFSGKWIGRAGPTA